MTHDETTIIAGALELSEKTASDAMTPISETFAIDINAKLDRYNVCSKQKMGSFPLFCGQWIHYAVVLQGVDEFNFGERT